MKSYVKIMKWTFITINKLMQTLIITFAIRLMLTSCDYAIVNLYKNIKTHTNTYLYGYLHN